MGRLFEISILTSLFAIVNGNVVVDELKDRQQSVDSALRFMKIGLQEFSEGIEKMVMKRLERVENIVDETINQMKGNATRNIIEDQSTDQNEKNSKTLHSTFQTEQQQKIESPTTRVNKKISDLLFTTEIEQRLFRQELISVTASLFGKLEKISDVLFTTQNEQQLLIQEIKYLSTNLSKTVDEKISDLTSTAQTEQQHLRQKIEFLAINLTATIERKISDVLSKTQTDQRLLNQEIKSLSTNLSEKVDQKISNLITTTQTEQRHVKEKIESITINLTGTIEDKIRAVLLTTQTQQRLLSQKMEYFTTNLTRTIEEKISDVLSTTHTKQQDLDQKTESLLANFSEKVDKKIGHKLSSIQTEQQILKQEVLSLTSNLVGKVDDIRNTSIYVAEQLFSGEAINMIRNVEVISQSLLHYIADADCAVILEKYPPTRGNNGVYNVIDSSFKSKAVYCDMTTDNGGWTVIQRRVNGSVDFYRNWMEYKNGFGFVDHEYWIGNDMLHRLTSQKPQELRVDMQRFNGEKAYAIYSRFSVGDEASKYKLQVNGYSGSAGDSLAVNTDSKFSTRDQDNDGNSCAITYRSAGWFSNCFSANPNGQYTDSEITGGKYIVWYDWKYSTISLKSIQLMIRPRA